MILTGPAIRAHLAAGTIAITPLDDDQIDQAGVTLHLHPKVLRDVEYLRGPGGEMPGPLDVRKDNGERLRQVQPTEDGAFLLRAGCRYLGATIERVRTGRYVARVDGKSSLGRLWFAVHVTAGHVEPGFDGQITLEMIPHADILIPPGWPVCQAVFHEVTGPVESYQDRGHYSDAGTVEGPQVSRSHLHRARHV